MSSPLPVCDKPTARTFRWRHCVTRLIFPAGLFVITLLGALGQPARAQVLDELSQTAGASAPTRSHHV